MQAQLDQKNKKKKKALAVTLVSMNKLSAAMLLNKV